MHLDSISKPEEIHKEGEGEVIRRSSTTSLLKLVYEIRLGSASWLSPCAEFMTPSRKLTELVT